MADNFHSLDTEELDQEQLELDMVAVKTKTNFLTVSGNINLDTVATNQTTFTNKLSGASSSGLKTLIQGNDTDITSINEKLASTSGSGLKTLIDVNTSKVSFPGIGTSGSTCLAGNTTTITSNQASKITSNENAINGIEDKTDFISITQNCDLDTMESNIATNNAKVGITTSQANAITANTSKTGITTSQANAITANTSKTGITTTQANNISTNNSKVGISTAQGNAINALVSANATNTTKLNLIGITSSVNLNSLVTQSNANVSDITALENAFPRHTIVRHYNYTTGDIYNDGTVKFNWDGSNKQLRFWILSIGTNEYTVGGVKIWKGTTEIRKSIYISQNVSQAYKYFTSPQTNPTASVVDNVYDLKTSYGTAEYFLCPYLEENYPSYEIKILIGYYLGWHTISIKRFT